MIQVVLHLQDEGPFIADDEAEEGEEEQLMSMNCTRFQVSVHDIKKSHISEMIGHSMNL